MEAKHLEIYLTAFYFVLTTMTTVGYGEISQVNIYERFLGIVILVVGSVCFSFLAGSVTSLLANNDQMTEGLKWKLDTLTNIK